jgi:hypothetical protein
MIVRTFVKFPRLFVENRLIDRHLADTMSGPVNTTMTMSFGRLMIGQHDVSMFCRHSDKSAKRFSMKLRGIFVNTLPGFLTGSHGADVTAKQRSPFGLK